MVEKYTVTQDDFTAQDRRKRKNSRWLQWASEVGLKPGDKWTVLEYMAWVNSH